ncbi:MAG: hypothetical protein RLZZ461_391 [Planctomycetota bacterium]
MISVRSVFRHSDSTFEGRAMRWLVGVAAMCGASSMADDCPQPLEDMPTLVETLPSGLIHRQPLALTQTRLVYADYLRTPSWEDRIVDVGTGWLENRSSRRRRVRYHHQFPLDRRPMVMLGSISSGATRPATFDFRVGCHPLDPEWTYHVIEGDADRFALRVEAVLEPGERVLVWWNVLLDIAVSGRLPSDRDGDGDVDLDDLSTALATLGTEDPARESEALRSLVSQLGTVSGRADP